jgi:hypothetical protein
MSAGTLAGVIREHGIRTVLNFRGASPKQAWYFRRNKRDSPTWSSAFGLCTFSWARGQRAGD